MRKACARSLCWSAAWLLGAQVAAAAPSPVKVLGSHLVVEAPSPQDALRVEQDLREIQRQEAADRAAAAPAVPNLMPPSRLEAPPARPTEDPVNLIIYYGALLLALVSVVVLLYRFLIFNYGFDAAPTLSIPQPVASGGAAEFLIATTIKPQPEQPSEPTVLAAVGPMSPAEPPAGPTFADLLSAAAKLLGSTEGWVQLDGVAKALGANEQMTAKVLEGLVETGRVREAKAADGQTVYRRMA